MTENTIEQEWQEFVENYELTNDIKDILKLVIKEISGEDYSRNTDYYDGFRDAMGLALYEIFIHEHINYHTNVEDTLAWYENKASYKIGKILTDMEESANRRED